MRFGFRSITLIAILIGALLLVINHFFYSWLGTFANKVGLCECKRIYVPGENGHPVNLSFLMDLNEVSVALSANPEYEVNYDRTYLSISRVYDGVRYSLVFDNFLNERRGNVTTMNMNSYPQKEGESRAEKYSTPAYTIKQHVFEMIGDLPLSSNQKNEMGSVVRVGCEIKFEMPLL